LITSDGGSQKSAIHVHLNINVYARGENKMYKTDITLVGGTSLEIFDNVNIEFDILSFNLCQLGIYIYHDQI
jgi:hypothetical protein